jgi:hypothetical protein
VKTDTVEADAVIMDGFSAEDEKKVAESKESFQFQAEVNRLMEILINSLCNFFFFINLFSISCIVTFLTLKFVV